jgi:hypothetical protein
MKIRAFDIRWDTDGFRTKLPSEMVLNVGLVDKDQVHSGELDDIVGDKLTAETGWCHFGFEYEILD